MTHTPTPWIFAPDDPSQLNIFGDDGSIVAAVDHENENAMPNAALIVRAVNSYEALVEAVYTAIPYLEDCSEDEAYKRQAVLADLRQLKKALALTQTTDRKAVQS
jgi:hypothetical protein